MTERLPSLDGLRGVAALVVAFSHVLHTGVPGLVGTSEAAYPDQRFPGFGWWLSETPLRLTWAGSAAVIVFFVLSGFVLALPFLRPGSFDARGYYPRRLLRLYLPVWGALALAALLSLAVERTRSAGASWFLNGHAMPLSAHEAAEAALLVGDPATYSLLTVIWSLEWEVLFSLALPLYLLAARWAARHGVSWALAAASLALVAVAGDRGAGFLACFMLGAVMAFERARVARVAAAVSDSRALRVLLPVAAALALAPMWWLGRSAAAVAFGAALAVLLALTHEPLRRVLGWRAVQWLGTRSFSLYLVHEPVVVALGFLMGGTPPPALFVIVALAAALVVADAFLRVVEGPAHALSRDIGRRLGRA